MRANLFGAGTLALLVSALVLFLVMPVQSGFRAAFGADPYLRESPKPKPKPRPKPRPRPRPQPVEEPEESAPGTVEPAVAQPAVNSRRGGRGADDEEMVEIPAGAFQMGSNDGSDDEKPLHTVHVDAFWMDKHEVSNRRYGRFMQATGHQAPAYWTDSRFNQPEQPVVGVSWNDAVAFCGWAGKRLPTEAEWEKAARGGMSQGKYPWGDADPQGKACYNLDSSTGRPMSVGSYAPNGYGLYDMAGNVLEWCADWYGKDFYGVSPQQNPRGPASGEYRVVRGGAWIGHGYLRCSYRSIYAPASMRFCHGFRCVR